MRNKIRSLLKNSVDNGFNGYRLWDCVHLPDTPFYPKGFNSLQDFTSSKWPTSIAGEYCLKNFPETKFNSDLFKSVVFSKISHDKPIDRIAIHLRVGDVIKNKNEKGIKGVQSRQRFLPPKDYNLVTEKILPFKDLPVFLVFGMHQHEGLNESISYIEYIYKIFESNGFKVNLQSSTPDEDFLFLCASSHLVSSKANYFQKNKALIRLCAKDSIIIDL